MASGLARDEKGRVLTGVVQMVAGTSWNVETACGGARLQLGSATASFGPLVPAVLEPDLPGLDVAEHGALPDELLPVQRAGLV
jgi:hypothetical protein